MKKARLPTTSTSFHVDPILRAVNRLLAREGLKVVRVLGGPQAAVQTSYTHITLERTRP